MTNPELEATEDGRKRLSRIAEIDGYLSLLMVVPLSLLTVVGGRVPLSPLFSLFPDTYGLLLMLLVFTIWVWAVLFAVGGARHGTGMGRAIGRADLGDLGDTCGLRPAARRTVISNHRFSGPSPSGAPSWAYAGFLFQCYYTPVPFGPGI